MNRILRVFILLCLIVNPVLVRAQSVTVSCSTFSSSSYTGCYSAAGGFYFNATISGGCSGTPSYIWDIHSHSHTFGSGSSDTTITSSASSLFMTFPFADTFDVSVTVSGCGGASFTTTRTSYVILHAAPIVDFTTLSPGTDTILSCAPKTITFISNSTNADTTCGYSINWAIDGTYPTGYSVTHTFTAPGTYPISMVYSNHCGCSGYASKTTYIKIQAAPVACFRKMDTTALCGGSADTVSFDASCTTGATTYRWNFSDGSTSGNLSTPYYTQTYASSTTGYVSDTLLAISSAGCVSRIAHDSDVYIGNFQATLGALPALGTAADTICSGASITFSDSSYIGGTAVTYNFVISQGGVGVDSVAGTNPATFTVNGSGLFTVTDNVTNAAGCSSFDFRTFWVRPSPSISAVWEDVAFRCDTPVTQHFHSTVTPSTGLTYTWLFGDGLSTSGASLGSPTHVYHTRPGRFGTDSAFTDTLIVRNSFGCADTMIDSNHLIIEEPHFAVALDVDSGCVSAGHPLHVGWHFTGEPSTVPYSLDSVKYDTSSWVCLSCTDSAVSFTTAGDTSYSGGYQHHGYHYLYYYWSLPASMGGCSGIFVDSVRAGGVLPNGSINGFQNAVGGPGADTICPGTVVVFDDGCTNCTYTQWFVHTGSANYNFNSADSATEDTTSAKFFIPTPFVDHFYGSVIMTVNGCSTYDTFAVNVLRPDTGTISYQESCTNRDSVKFTLNTSYTSSVRNYTWYFGGSHAARDTTNPIWHNFGTGFTGNVDIIALDSGDVYHHCGNASHLTIHIGKPVLNWTITSDTICVNSMDTYFGPLNPDTTSFNDYYWYFGDGSPSVHTSLAGMGQLDSTTTHTFTSIGNYWDTVIVVNGSGCRDTATRKRVTVVSPIGGFSVSDTLVCSGETVTFIDTSRDVIAINARRHWTFNAFPPVSGSSLTSTPVVISGTTATATFAPAGYYHIKLSDSDRYCQSDFAHYVHAVKPSTYITSADSGKQVCIGLPVYFTDTSTDCSYSWSFDGGAHWTTASDTAQTIMHMFTANGTFSVECAIFKHGTAGSGYPAGCTDTSGTISMHVGPQSLSSHNIGDVSPISCPPLNIGLSADVITDTYKWIVSYGGGGIDTFSGPFLSDVVTTSGNVNVKMIGTTSVGCSDTVQYNYIIGGPAGYITVVPDSGCNPIPVTVTFVDTGVIPSSANYIWSLCPSGDTTTTTSSFTINYATPGTYCPPTVIIQNGTCAVRINYPDSLRVYPLPFVGVNHLTTLCYDSTATLIATGASHYTWNPSYGITYYNPGDSAYVSVQPLATTTYTVIGTSPHGCIDSATTTVTVDPELHIAVHGRDSMCIGLCDTLIVTGVPGASYIWSGTGTSCAVCDTNVVCITSTKTFTVSGTDAAGCAAITSFKVTVNPSPVLHVLPNNPAYICRHEDTTHLYAIGAASYVWKPLAGLSCDSCADPICSIPTNLVYTLTGTSKFGCRDSIIVPVTVFDTTMTSISTDTNICAGTSAHLSTTGGVSFIWRPTTGLSDPTIYDPIATPAVTTTYTVYITENVCFKDTLHVTVNVIPLPLLTMPANVSIIAGNSVQLFANPSNEVHLTNYSWTPADETLTCFDCPRPIATPLVTTTYSVTATTKEGCTGKGDVTITVLCESSQIFIPNTFTPNGDGVNDRFFVSGKGLGNIAHMTVFNRWGEIVYEATNISSNDPGAGWDGTYKGSVLPPDVFVYKIDVLCTTGELFSFQGDISIVR